MGESKRKSNRKRYVYVFSGDGKGKTSAALGVAIRSLLIGRRVLWVSFLKSESWDISEKKLSSVFDNLDMYFVGKGFFIEGDDVAKVNGGVVVDGHERGEHVDAVLRGLEFVRDKLSGDVNVSGSGSDSSSNNSSNSSSNRYDLVVLDEINNAIKDGLVDESLVVELLESVDDVDFVVTGRLGDTSRLVDVADLVTECVKLKHPYDSGGVAVKGLDY